MNFLKPFIDGTLHTIKVQTGETPVIGKPFLKSKTMSGHPIDIAGTISIWTGSFRGTIYLCFPQTTYLTIMNKILSENYTVIDADIEDGAGEFMNIIFGFAKTILNEQGHDLEKTLPGIITGNGLRVRQDPKTAVIILPFETSFGGFQLEVGIER